jgi:hypothetical protein
MQAEEVEEASESEKEMVEPEPQRQPEPIKRKLPQVRPWDIGKEGELCPVHLFSLTHLSVFIHYLLSFVIYCCIYKF